MFAMYAVLPPLLFTRITSMRPKEFLRIRSTTSMVSFGTESDLIQSFPEPIGTTPSRNSSVGTPVAAHQRQMPLNTSCREPSPPTAMILR